MRAWRRAPLALRLFLALSAAMWAVLSVYFAYDVLASRRRLLGMERSTLQALFPTVSKMLEGAMLDGDPHHLRGLFSDPGRHASPHAMYLLDPDGQAVDIDDLVAGRRPRRAPPPRLDSKYSVSMDFPMGARAACLHCHKGRGEGDLLGYVRLVSPHHEKAQALSAMAVNHLVILLSMIGLTGAITLVIVRRLIQAPLAPIAEAMTRVARGDLDARVPDAGEGEIGAIGRGFNAMVCDLERDRRKILDLHRRQVAHMERLVAVGELAAHLAHEVRNPLTGIGSAVQVMQRETAEDNPRREVLGKILGQLQRMERTMANFLQYARMPEAVVRPFELREPLQRVFFLIEPRVKSQRVAFEHRVPDGLPPLTGDPGQLEQVFLNLCLNSLQAMPGGGVLRVEARREEDSRILVEVSDTGVGIPPGELESVFKPFFTTREKGSGLGLPICRQIVSAHGGEIWLESVPAKGTSVFVRLPTGASNGGGD